MADYLSVIILVVAFTFAAGANAVSFSITNQCSFTVWPTAIPVGGGRNLNSHETWNLDVPDGTSTARIWRRTGCNFNGSSGSCATGDCEGALSCSQSGEPPATLAEYLLGNEQYQDFYDISTADGFNIDLDFSCSSGITLHCESANNCYDTPPNPNGPTPACGGNRS